MALSFAKAQSTVTPFSVKGMVGQFLVETNLPQERVTDIHFGQAIANIGRRLENPGVTLLEERILPPEEWIRDPYYCGPITREIWPKKIHDFIAVAQGNVTEVILTGAIGIGKSWILKAICQYDLYRLSCLKNPQAALGIGSSDKIKLVLVSTSVTKAQAKLLQPLRTQLSATPYFREKFRFNKRIESKIVLPKSIEVTTGVTGEDAVHSEDVIFIGITEANFLPVVKHSQKKFGHELDVADDLVEATTRRMISRFQQSGAALPMCRIILDSSRDHPTSYLERRIAQIKTGRVAHNVIIVERSLWEAKEGVRDASGQYYFSGETFPVEVGSDNRFSRILTEQEAVESSGEVIRVPVELRASFEVDLEGALRDLAGRAIISLRLLFPSSQKVDSCIRTVEGGWPAHTVDHPMTELTTTLQDSVKLVEPNLVSFSGLASVPLVNPDMPRTVHIDIGLARDFLGFAMGHVYDVVEVVRGVTPAEAELPCRKCGGEKVVACTRCLGIGTKRYLGTKVRCAACNGDKFLQCGDCRGTGKAGIRLSRPVHYLDFVLGVMPPKDAQIQLDDVESLIQEFRALGFVIPVVTADGHQSVQFLQRQSSVYGTAVAEKLSVDKSRDPYYTLRDAVQDRLADGKSRLSIYDYPILRRELYRLEDGPFKIDHPHGGSKDVADAVAGVVFNLERFPGLRVPVNTSGVQALIF